MKTKYGLFFRFVSADPRLLIFVFPIPHLLYSWVSSLAMPDSIAGRSLRYEPLPGRSGLSRASVPCRTATSSARRDCTAG
jgi:hypothetical protein